MRSICIQKERSRIEALELIELQTNFSRFGGLAKLAVRASISMIIANIKRVLEACQRGVRGQGSSEFTQLRQPLDNGCKGGSLMRLRVPAIENQTRHLGLHVR